MPDYKRDMRLDTRLIRRHGWLSAEELEKELAALPDVADKVQPPEEAEEGAASPPGGEPDPKSREEGA